MCKRVALPPVFLLPGTSLAFDASTRQPSVNTPIQLVRTRSRETENAWHQGFTEMEPPLQLSLR